ncbi:MAG TPA: multicopper oxidase domain-containing protein [Solirubrobacterales bacterium]|nr:multicopper oxidase domain-containing protein [Solirubrobacterales bacterium]
MIDGKGEYTPGTASPYVGPTWKIQPGDRLVIEYINDLQDIPFTPASTGKPVAMPQPINLHTHGLTVNPSGNSDNVLLSIPPGRSNRFTIDVPEDQNHGLYWYHPHIHGLTDDQVYSGLAGHIIVGRADGDYKEFDGLRIRDMMIRYNVRKKGEMGELIDASATNTKGTALEPRGEMIYSVNGREAPEVPLNPDESQIWAFTNITGSASYVIALEEVDKEDALKRNVVGKPLDFNIVSVDGTPMHSPESLTGNAARRGYLLGQGGRAAVLVQGPSDPSKVVRLVQVENRSGTGDRSAYNWQDQVWGGGWRDYTRDVLAVSSADPDYDGTKVELPKTLTANYEYGDELYDDDEVDYRRTYVFNSVMDPTESTPNNFPIDNALFPENAVEQPRAGTVEEWTILNYSSLHHPFHVHTQFSQSMRIVAPNGKNLAGGDGVYPSVQHVTDLNQKRPNPFNRDVINLPPARVDENGNPVLDENGQVAEPGVIVLRLKFRDYLGTYVEHCHRLPHEDRGMMSMVRTIPERPVYAGAAVDKVTVFDGTTDKSLKTITQESSHKLAVAVGDIDHDTIPDVAIGSRADESSPSKVRIYSGASGWDKVIREIEPFDDDGTVSSLAFGDLNGDGTDDLITGEGRGGKSRVIISNGSDSKTLADFSPYGDAFEGGVSVAADAIVSGGRISLITGAGPGGPALVKAFNFDLFGDSKGNFPDVQSKLDPIEVSSFLFGPEGYGGGVNVDAGYPFAADGGFASIIASSAGEYRRMKNQVTVYSMMGDDHMGPSMVSMTGVSWAHSYDPAAKLMVHERQTIPTDTPLTATAVSTPSDARVVIFGKRGAGGIYQADGPGTRLKRTGNAPAAATSAGGI